jgi:hypothetical protein
VINDHLAIAAIGAEEYHLGQEDFFDAGHTHIAELTVSEKNTVLAGGLSAHALPNRRSGRWPLDRLHRDRTGLYRQAPSRQQRPVDAGICARQPMFSAVVAVASAWAIWIRCSRPGRPVCVVSAILNAPDVAAAYMKSAAGCRADGSVDETRA